MNRFRGLGGCVVALVWLAVGAGCACAADSDAKSDKAKSVVIPLDQIWALDMPETKDIRRLEPAAFFRREFPVKSLEEGQRLHAGSLTVRIRQALQEGKREAIANIQRRGFVVQGRGIDALRAIHRVLAKKEDPQTVFRPGADLSLCFYSLQVGTYVQLTSVIKKKNCIELHYHFQAHHTSDMSDHFAMIPLSCSDKGKVSVEIIQDPNLWKQPKSWELGDPKTLTTNDKWGEDLICRPFSFIIE